MATGKGPELEGQQAETHTKAMLLSKRRKQNTWHFRYNGSALAPTKALAFERQRGESLDSGLGPRSTGPKRQLDALITEVPRSNVPGFSRDLYDSFLAF